MTEQVTLTETEVIDTLASAKKYLDMFLINGEWTREQVEYAIIGAFGEAFKESFKRKKIYGQIYKKQGLS